VSVRALPRMPFVLLVLVLLGGGLICLLVINTTLGATSFQISQLQNANATLATREQTLQQQIAAAKSPAEIARRAYALGMRSEVDGNILDLARHRFYQLPGQASTVTALGANSSTAPSPAAIATAGTSAKPSVGASVSGAHATTRAPRHRRRSRR
jgi:hypothetical protein